MHDLYDDFAYAWYEDTYAAFDQRNTRTDERRTKPMTDIEALRHAGFDAPSFFYEVVLLYTIATAEFPARGGGFSCITSP